MGSGSVSSGRLLWVCVCIGLKLPALPSACTYLSMPKPKNAAPASYEAALEELDLLIGRVESAQLPLDEMLAAYQRGEVLMAFCRQRLDAVQDQIKVLDDAALKPVSL